MPERIIIFDTTLRDGEQSPGASLSVFEKVEIARQLERLGVDVIEAGFPVSSPAQFEAVQRISDQSTAIIAGLCRAVEKDIRTAYEALKNARRKRIHTFTSTSDIHILGKFGDPRYGQTLAEKQQTILKMTVDAVSFAKTLTADVEYSAEDAGRTDIGYLAEVIEAAIAAGATTVNIPDTTGYCMPEEFGKKIAELKRRVKNIDQAVISVHCHNDLGLAVANSLSAVLNGARQVECTINGIGERAGNASMEEIVMALTVRKDLWPFETGIQTQEIYNSSKMVSAYTGLIVQPNKAIVGDNAFAHESGIHQDGVLKNRQTYEIMTPETVGVLKNKIVLGRHSGRHGLVARIRAMGFEMTPTELDDLYEKFLDVADKKKEVYDDDLRVLMGEEVQRHHEEQVYDLDYLQVTLGSTIVPTATVRIKTKNGPVQASSAGDGPVDAAFKALEAATGTSLKIENYQVRSVTSGRDAMGEVILRIRDNGKTFTGKGTSTDIIEASVRAYLNGLNHKFHMEKMWQDQNATVWQDNPVRFV
ncbi:MAG: 2-isopropylmalate synthase [Bacteroidetes bacterium]|nr:2-isopropylmalate synthase [Bacteroidota bacterium]